MREPGKLERTESFIERQNFADVESEDGELPHKSGSHLDPAVPNRKIRRGSRSSRGNSLSETPTRPYSTSPTALDSSEIEDSSSPGTENSFAETKKRRKKRKRTLDDGVKAFRRKMVNLDQLLSGDFDEEGNSLETLRELASNQNGLLDDDIRKKAWPKLVNVSPLDLTLKLPSQAECETHQEYNQVVLDVNRSLKRFPPGIKEEARPALQDQLTRLIVRVLIQHPELHYYQGYHDVAITFLLVVGENLGFHIMNRLSITHLKEFMAPTMERTTHLLNYMYPIIARENRDLFEHLEHSEVGTIFALPWMITWFGHVLSNYEDVVRLYDFFLAKPPLMPVYLAASLVLHRQHEVLMCECDLAMMHALLSRIPVDLPFEKLLIDACDLYDQYPPNTLDNEVTRRMKKLQEAQEKVRSMNRKSNRPNLLFAIPAVTSVLVIAAPVLIGYAAWRYVNS